MRDRIVVVSTSEDPHVQTLEPLLEDRGYPLDLIATDQIPSAFEVAVGTGRSGPVDGIISTSPERPPIALSTIRTIWWRRPLRYFGIPSEAEERDREFAKGEIGQTLFGALNVVGEDEALWVSHPARIREASWKVEQLHRASRLGFKVPRTLFTSDAEQARRLLESLGGVPMIYKVLTDPFLGALALAHKYSDRDIEASERVLTTRVTADLLDSLGDVPCQFQEEVPKAFEYRVVVIGNVVHAARIDSQSSPDTQLDWRAWETGGLDIEYRATTLPPAIERRCLDLVQSYGLRFSAIDLIETPDGEWYFLENNANGQFLFVEQLAPELKLADAMADLLVAGHAGA